MSEAQFTCNPLLKDILVEFQDLDFNLSVDLKAVQWEPSVEEEVSRKSERSTQLVIIRNSLQPQNPNSETKWRAIRYQNGYFANHIDLQLNQFHSSTEILLPPQNQCSYKGGELVIEEQIKIRPHQEKWTYIRCPLGLIHRVDQTEGTRISFIRAVYGLEPFILKIDHERVRALQAKIDSITG